MNIICKKYGIEAGSEDFVVTVIKKPEDLYVAWDNIDANTDAVFINMHGSQSELLLSSDKNAPSIDIGRLSGKTIDSVILLACFNGTQAGGYENVATQILDNNKINNGVIASVMPIYGKVVDEYKDDRSHLNYTRYRTEGNGFYIFTEERDNNNNYRRHRLREGMWATNTYTNVVVIINTASRVLENYKARKS